MTRYRNERGVNRSIKSLVGMIFVLAASGHHISSATGNEGIRYDPTDYRKAVAFIDQGAQTCVVAWQQGSSTSSVFGRWGPSTLGHQQHDAPHETFRGNGHACLLVSDCIFCGIPICRTAVPPARRWLTETAMPRPQYVLVRYKCNASGIES